jgi:hypothetical protein
VDTRHAPGLWYTHVSCRVPTGRQCQPVRLSKWDGDKKGGAGKQKNDFYNWRHSILHVVQTQKCSVDVSLLVKICQLCYHNENLCTVVNGMLTENNLHKFQLPFLKW